VIVNYEKVNYPAKNSRWGGQNRGVRGGGG
jgi:hypothetical protein